MQLLYYLQHKIFIQAHNQTLDAFKDFNKAEIWNKNRNGNHKKTQRPISDPKQTINIISSLHNMSQYHKINLQFYKLHTVVGWLD